MLEGGESETTQTVHEGPNLKETIIDELPNLTGSMREQSKLNLLSAQSFRGANLDIPNVNLAGDTSRALLPSQRTNTNDNGDGEEEQDAIASDRAGHSQLEAIGDQGRPDLEGDDQNVELGRGDLFSYTVLLNLSKDASPQAQVEYANLSFIVLAA